MMVVYKCRCVELGTRLGDGCVQNVGVGVRDQTW